MENSFSQKYWQLAFVVGLVIFILTAILVLGQTSVTALVAVISLIIAVLNALLGARPSAPKDQTWLQTCLTKMFHVSPLLKATTCLVWLSTVGLIAYGLYVNLEAKQIITLRGHVLTAQGSSADNAVVKLYLSGGKERIENASGGKFVFNQVNISHEPKSLGIEAFWQGTSKKVEIDLTKGVPDEVTINLPPGKPPFRVQYFKLNGTAIDQLTRGEITPDWEKRLSGKPYIVPNSVFVVLKSLLDNFSISFPYAEGYIQKIRKSSSYENQEPESSGRKEEEEAAKRKGTPFFIGAQDLFWEINIRTFNNFVDLLKPLVEWNSEPYIDPYDKQMDFLQLWHRNLKNYYHINSHINNLYIGSFKKYASTQDLYKIYKLANAHKKHLEYLLHITKQGVPSDFCPIELELSFEECGAAAGWNLVVFPPEMEVKIAVIENVESQPVHLGNFLFKENKNLSLRNREDDQVEQQRQESQTKDWFAFGLLKPGEKILIPLEIIFVKSKVSEKWKKEQLDSLGDDHRNKIKTDYQILLSQLDNVNNINIPFPLQKIIKTRVNDIIYDDWVPTGEKDLLQISSKDLLKIIEPPYKSEESAKEYLYGPSVNINSIEIDRVKYAFRPEDTHNLVLYAGLAIGSCPYVFTYSAQKNEWINEGHILYGKNSRAKESNEEKLLERFDGRVLLKELEAELAFIDILQIKVVSLTGKQQILFPDNHKLRHKDGNYVSLAQGDSLEVNFEKATILPGDKVFLISRGYFLPKRK
jgi:hypothetical protein